MPAGAGESLTMPQTDIQLCEKVCAAAKALGWKIDDLGTRAGQSFVFVSPEGQRVSSGICATREGALIKACKAVMPHIANEL